MLKWTIGKRRHMPSPYHDDGHAGVAFIRADRHVVELAQPANGNGKRKSPCIVQNADDTAASKIVRRYATPTSPASE
jgi:hypothetical protein